MEPSDLRLLRRAHNLGQVDVGRSMLPPVSRQRVDQLERHRRLSPEQWRRVAAGIMAAGIMAAAEGERR